MIIKIGENNVICTGTAPLKVTKWRDHGGLWWVVLMLLNPDCNADDGSILYSWKFLVEIDASVKLKEIVSALQHEDDRVVTFDEDG